MAGFNRQPVAVFNSNMNQNVIDTSIPPPNFPPAVAMQSVQFQPNINFNPVGPPHAPGMHPMQFTLPTATPNYLQTSSFSGGSGIDSSAMWNTTDNTSSINNTCLSGSGSNFTGNYNARFQTSPSPPVWQNYSPNNPTYGNNTSNQTIANQYSGHLQVNNEQNQRAFGNDFNRNYTQNSGNTTQFQTPQCSTKPNGSNFQNFNNTQSFRSDNSVGQLATNQTVINNTNQLSNGNQVVTHKQVNSNSLGSYGYNFKQHVIQKTNLPDMKIFSNTNVIFGVDRTSNPVNLNTGCNVSANNFNVQNSGFNNNQSIRRIDVPVNSMSIPGNINFFNSRSDTISHQNGVADHTFTPFTTEMSISGSKTRVSQHKYQNLIDVPVFLNDGEECSGQHKKKPQTQDNSFNSNFYEKNNSNFRTGNSHGSNLSGNNFTNTFQNSHTRNFKQENTGQKQQSWMTENIQNALQERNKLLVEAKRTNSQETWDAYKALRDKINEDIRNAKGNKYGNNEEVRYAGSKFGFPKNAKKAHLRNERLDRKKLPFYCDTCDRSFATDEEFKCHTSMHTKCDYDGCIFEAHPKVVALHQKMQHETGYAEAINKLQSDEEIKKWREERKNRFPTAENILKRKAEQAEKEARGEVVEDQDFGKFKRPRFGQNDSAQNRFNRRGRRGNPRNRHRHRHPLNRPPLEPLPDSPDGQGSDSDAEEACHIKVPRFTGMKKELEDLPFEVIDIVKDADNDTPTELPTSKIPLDESENAVIEDQVNADADSDAPTELPISKAPLDESENADQANTKDSDDDSPAEIPISKVPIDGVHDSLDDAETEDNKESAEETSMEIQSVNITPNDANNGSNEMEKKPSDQENKINNNSNKRKHQNVKQPRPNFPPRRRHSLLEMLLDGEIRHERNVIMQCIRHIVRNQFFRKDNECNSDKS